MNRRDDDRRDRIKIGARTVILAGLAIAAAVVATHYVVELLDYIFGQ